MNKVYLQKTLLQAISNNKKEVFIQLCNDSSFDCITLYNLNLNKLSQSCIHLACIFDSVDILQYIWETSNHSHNLFLTKDSCYKEPLHHACQLGNVRCVHWLLDNIKDINVNSMKKADWTSLMLAVVCKNKSINVINEIVKTLIDHGADTRLKNKDGWTALHLSCKEMNIEIVKTLSEVASDSCTMRSYNGRSPLHTASLAGNIAVIEYLVTNFYPNVNIVDDCGMTPLMDALVGGHLEICKWFLEFTNSSPQCYDQLGRHTIHVVCQNGPSKSVSFMLERFPDFVNLRTLDGNSTPLLSAAKMKRKDVIELLLNHGSDIMAVDNMGRSYECFI